MTTTTQTTGKALTIRRGDARGHADHGWLRSAHSFSFADYYDPAHMGFRSLRVINEDRVQPARGFGAHSHQNMEIISYVLGGSLEHKDSMGTGSVIRPGDVQRMSAGTGVAHSEFNASKQEQVHFLQIWILPERAGIRPSYEQKHFTEEERRNALRLLAARDGRDGAITVHQDAELWGTLLAKGAKVQHELRPGRHAWIQVARGAVTVNGEQLEAGDGASTSAAGPLAIEGIGEGEAEVLLFDLA